MDIDTTHAPESILITGGTGTFGQACVRALLDYTEIPRIVVFSRDETKQHHMVGVFREDTRLRFFIGDVRDRGRLRSALDGVEMVIHAAAMKQVPACEYNPIEAVKTNVGGAENVISAAIDARVRRVVALGSDKEVNPVNLYGATKLVAEKLFIQANCLSIRSGTEFCTTRYGNVLGSRGSVVEVFRRQRTTGAITITDPHMTRFILTIEQAVGFVLSTLFGVGWRKGYVYVPELPSIGVLQIAHVVAPGCRVETIGIRPGEKLHETLISSDEARYTDELPGGYGIRPPFDYWGGDGGGMGTPVPADFFYSSNTNTWWLTQTELGELLGEEGEHGEIR